MEAERPEDGKKGAGAKRRFFGERRKKRQNDQVWGREETDGEVSSLVNMVAIQQDLQLGFKMGDVRQRC